MNIVADIDSVLASQREVELDLILSTVFPDDSGKQGPSRDFWMRFGECCDTEECSEEKLTILGGFHGSPVNHVQALIRDLDDEAMGLDTMGEKVDYLLSHVGMFEELEDRSMFHGLNAYIGYAAWCVTSNSEILPFVIWRFMREEQS